MYRISCYARMKKNFFHYKKDSIVGLAVRSVLDSCIVSIKKERYDFMTETEIFLPTMNWLTLL